MPDFLIIQIGNQRIPFNIKLNAVAFAELFQQESFHRLNGNLFIFSARLCLICSGSCIIRFKIFVQFAQFVLSARARAGLLLGIIRHHLAEFLFDLLGRHVLCHKKPIDIACFSCTFNSQYAQ